MFPAGDVCGGSTAGVSGRGGFGGRRRKRKWRRGGMEEPEMQLKVKKVTDKFTESMYVLANEPSVALYRLQEHVRRSLPELAQHKRCCPTSQESSSQFLILDKTGHPLLPSPAQLCVLQPRGGVRNHLFNL
ncbi:BLOC-1-related complex subunit 8 isoform X2 [Falco biarmicus]|uniref:BLOC-1-related complex subunit 8 isoform X2 n=1 Tax=Falco cherrug TaxID=345164 RepID=UPI00247A97AE|nr:BLOC-1-related complex subunit 8 isoform X2 [Falco cherrug]XP_055660851.1 BLOC-1-related complex subunit 8 isoform X2 [Falco peregrinus]XP_056193431.1 BLOC-1-related complex subunit 8 isoform X2 [Falco biarmicus]